MVARIFLFFSLVSTAAYSQLQIGVYESTHNSYRKDYFLKVDSNEIVLIGWELNPQKGDTIFFMGKARLDTMVNKVELTDIRVSDKKMNPNDPVYFARRATALESYTIYRYILKMRQVKDTITFLATKDSYDSKSDRFEFKLIK